MTSPRRSVGVVAALLGCALAASAADDTGVLALSNRTFHHKDSKTALRVPDGWTIIPPYRLRKTTTFSALGLEKENPRVAVTIVWSPLGNRPWSDVIRAAEDENLGEEYALLRTVYGKDKVGRPTTMKVGPFTVFKVLLDDGPDDKSGKFAGAVYLFEAGAGDDRWKVKIRAVYPQVGREEYIRQVEEVIGQFTREE
jgi:hypothetical protein